jgi:hypothetical protein
MFTKSLEVISSGNVFEEQLGSPLPHFGSSFHTFYYRTTSSFKPLPSMLDKQGNKNLAIYSKYTKMLNPKLDSSS